MITFQDLERQFISDTTEVIEILNLAKQLAKPLDPVEESHREIILKYFAISDISNTQAYLAKLGVIILHASMEQYFKWLLASRLGFSSVEEARSLLGQLEFHKPNTLPSLDSDEKQNSFSKILTTYFAISEDKSKTQRAFIARKASDIYKLDSSSNNPKDFEVLKERYQQFKDARNAIAHEIYNSSSISLQTLEQYYVACKIVFVYYVGTLLFDCELPEEILDW